MIRTKELGFPVHSIRQSNVNDEWYVCEITYPDGGRGLRQYLIDDLEADGGTQEIMDNVETVRTWCDVIGCGSEATVIGYDDDMFYFFCDEHSEYAPNIEPIE